MKRTEFHSGWSFQKQGTEERKMITLPHDAMLYENRSKNNASTGACSCFEGGTYFYEKKFTAPEEWRTKKIQVYFEGIYQKSKIYLNGKEIGGCAYGYSSFLVTLAHLKYGETNTLRVVAKNDEMPNSRWYTGSGIYRPVSLLVGEKTHICFQGVKIRTLSYQPARIAIDVETTNGEVEVEIIEGNCVVAKGFGNQIELDIPDAKLWSEDAPNLYRCKVVLKENGTIVDEEEMNFGIRLIEYSTKGLFINGKETLLRGGCVHHDNGVLGAKSYAKSEWRRVKKLKESGYNAIRSSHNPCSEEMLNACDYYGVYMMDETWDMWYSHKNKFDYASDFMENFRFDLESMVKKDYNHPSVIMYSIGNEISEPASQKGVELEKDIVAYLHRLDVSRPVTCGLNLMILSRAAKGNAIYKEEGGRDTSNEKNINSSLMFNMITSMVGSGMNKGANSKKADLITTPAIDALDIAGYNYASGRYPLEEKVHPDRIIFGSETFPQDLAKNWAMVEKFPYLIGDFMWTSWDYLGEAGGGTWGYTEDARGFEKPYPWLLADMGAIDILGNPNGEVFWAQAIWHMLKNPAICVRPANHPGKTPAKSSWRGTNAIPSWSWSGCEGNKIIVEVYYDAATIVLYCNGMQIGKKKVKESRAMFKMKYMPGTLEAVAYDEAGKRLGSSKLVTSEGALAIRIAPEEERAVVGDILYVPVQIIRENGIVESNTDKTISVSVEGGELLGFGSANPRTEESFVEGTYTTYYGMAQAIVKVGKAETLTIRAETVDGTLHATCAMEIQQRV